MKTLLATFAFSGLLTCQSLEIAVEPLGSTSFQWGVGVNTGVGVRAQLTLHKSDLDLWQEPQPAKQDPKPEAKQPVKQEPVKQEPVKQEPVKQEPAKQDPKGTGTKEPVSKGKGDEGKGDEAKEEPRIDRPDKEQPIPAGTDPADIAAMKSAEDMLRAEKRLQEEIKSGKITGLDKILPFDELTSWPYEDALKGMPKRVKELSGKKVLMTGFMLPIDEVKDIKEFLLVESLWSCCYGQPPDIHGIVRVVMPSKKTTDYFFDPLKVIGTFKVEATMMDGYCVDIYQLHCDSLEALKFK